MPRKRTRPSGQEYLAQLATTHPHRVMRLDSGLLALRPQVRNLADGSTAPLRSPGRHRAAKLARAAHPQPEACEECGRGARRLYAHHLTPYAELKRQGRHRDPAAHVFQWLCAHCHKRAHDGEAVARIMPDE